MRHRRPGAIVDVGIGLVTVGWLHAAAAQASGTVLVLDDWGTYVAVSGPHVPDERSDIGHVTPLLHPSRVEQTTTICAHQGTRFGVQYHLNEHMPFVQLALQIEVRHPPILNPRHERQTVDPSETLLQAGEEGGNFWTFEEPQELVPGQWTMLVRHDGQELLRKDFTVITDCTKPIV